MKDEIEYKTKNAVAAVLLGNEESVALPGAYLTDVVKCMEEAGGEYLSDSLETNGWQWDFWADFTFMGKTFECSGSGYYGNLKFSLKK